VAADDGVRDPVALQQAQRLGEVARGHDRLDAGLVEATEDGPEEEDVWGVGEVDPDLPRWR
jgi:hypothetical protein